jgi:V/A-type H+-transporting ATPase subunit D
MSKIKLTKGELKRQRDSLKQFERYLPTLQLKKQQLQLEIVHLHILLEEISAFLTSKKKAVLVWAGLLKEQTIDWQQVLKPQQVILDSKNIAGVDIPLFNRADFTQAEYDLFVIPLWADAAVDHLRELVSLEAQIKVVDQGLQILRRELRITTQRVNLFEKIKIPEAEEAIRLIKIYIGDQMANAVGRSKIAKAKIEEVALEGAGV